MLVGQKLGNFEIVQLIEQGGMAAVYRATQTTLNRMVAVKVLESLSANDTVIRQRFDREAKAVAQLSHPNIVPIYDFGNDDSRGLWYIVMEYVPGGSLRDLAQWPLSIDEATRLIVQVAYALDYAHERGIIHRDIKPGNILLTETYRPMLTDFGLAKLETQSQFTESGVTIGTPAYMSPEQVLGADLDRRSDIYSLAMVLYELLTGRPPFRSDTPLAMLHQQVYEAPDRPRQVNPQISRRLERVLMRAMSKQREDRHGTAAAFAADLERTLKGDSVSLASVAGTRAVPPPVRRRAEWLGRLNPSSASSAIQLAARHAAAWSALRVQRALGWAARAALIAVVALFFAVASSAFLLAGYAERTIAGSRAEWSGINAEQPFALDQARLEGAVERYIASNGFSLVLVNPRVQLTDDENVVFNADSPFGPVRIDGRLFVMGGAVQVEIETVNGRMPDLYGTVATVGINRGLREFFDSGPMRLEHLETSPGVLTLFPKRRANGAALPAVEGMPAPRATAAP